MNKETAKQKIEELVEKYDNVVQEDRIGEYNEETTKIGFIQPLFHALGWDFENSSEVTAEETISKKRVDYGFRINGIPKFFLEAKPLKADLDNPMFADQAINYAWHKDCTWAVLTNFENIKIFNAEWKTADLMQSRFISLEYDKFLERFDRLWLLSKESFEQRLLDKEAEDYGKKSKKSHVGEQLFSDLTKWRSELSKDISQRNKDIKEVDLDEAVQRIIDRLIFIRNCEDRELEPPRLLPMVREWDSKHKGTLWEHVVKMFRGFDEDYNSKLFHPHPCEELDINNQVLTEMINGLYRTKDKSIRYDFSALDADVLGNVYEQYLGHILKKTAKRAIVEEKNAYRKEQGIYYTPTYIVDYIVRNTLGELLKEKKINVEKIRVLDPACGSGSFLIKAFDILNEFYSKAGGDQDQTQLDLDTGLPFKKKEKILLNNIFGVDLDTKAVEIAQLNLLLKIAEKKQRLPMLQQNIKCGNSLIDDEKIAGDKAFNWKQGFKQIMDEGGFDIVIGNPPYVRIQTLDKSQVDYFNKKYESPEKNYDIYILFIEKGFNLLKEGGILGLILPHKFFQGENGKKIRKFIHHNKALHKIVNFGTNQVFEDAATYTCLLFLQKKKNKEFYYMGFKLGENFKNLSAIKFETKDIESLGDNKWNFSGVDIQKILTKIKSHKKDFRSITKKIFKGSSTGDDKIFLLDLVKKHQDTSVVFSSALNQEIELENALLRPFVYGEDIRRYATLKSNKVLLFPYHQIGNNVELIPIESLRANYPETFDYLNKLKNELLKRKVELDGKNFYKYSAARSLSEYTQPKIMIPDMLISNRISFDEEGVFYHGPAIHSVVFNDEAKKHSQYFYLGLLNSTLFWFFVANTSTALRGNAYRLTPEFLTPFCFPEVGTENKELDKIVVQVDKMLSLNKRLNEIGDKKTDERYRIEEEIMKTDAEIDELVYKLYGITESEKKTIEESLK